MDSDFFKGSGIDIYPKGLSGGSSSSSSNTGSSDKGHMNLGGKEHTISSWLPGSKSNGSSGSSADEHYEKGCAHAMSAFRDLAAAGGLGVAGGLATHAGEPMTAAGSFTGAVGAAGLGAGEAGFAVREFAKSASNSEKK